MPSTTSTTSDFRLPPPARTSDCDPHPPVSTMPNPNSSPPIDIRKRHETRRGVEAVGGVDNSGRRQNIGAENRDGDCQQPLPHARPVAESDDIRNAAHRAEVGALRDRAERECQSKRQRNNQRGRDSEIGVWHRREQCRAARKWRARGASYARLASTCALSQPIGASALQATARARPSPLRCLGSP